MLLQDCMHWQHCHPAHSHMPSVVKMEVDGHSAGHLPLFQNPPPATALNAMSPRPTSASGSRVRIKAESPNYDRNEGPMMRRPSDDRSIHGSPFLQQQREASNLELFYDLFFAANLTVFTAVHEVRDGDTLKQYVVRKLKRV